MTHDQPGAPAPQAWVPQDAPAPTPQPAHQPEPTYQPAPIYQPAPVTQPAYQQQGYQQQGYGQPAFQPPGGPTSYPPGYQGGPPQAPAFPGGMPYGQPGYYAPAAPKPTPTLAIVGLVLAFLAPIVGLVVSIIALVRARTDGNGRGLAIAGLVVSIVATPILASIAIPVYLNQRQNAEQAGPREAFDQITAALAEADCDVYMARSTQAFRDQLGATTCDEFQAFVVMANSDPVGVGNVPVTDVEVDGDRAVVSTLERVVWTDGEPPTLQPFDYTMVKRDGSWLMDSVALGD